MISKYNNGSSTLEFIISIAIFTVLLTLVHPLINISIAIYKNIKIGSSSHDFYRIIEGLSAYVFSTTVETQNTNLLKVYNPGLAVLSINSPNLSSSHIKNISNFIVSEGILGDSLYLEIPSFHFNNYNPSKNIKSNQFHLYRFKVTDTKNLKINQELIYSRGKTSGDRYGGFQFGKDEILLSKIYNGSFTEIKGGILLKFQTNTGIKIDEILLRNGQL
ncbi:MAG: hypothetical protein ACRC6K_00470 [Fusobacteriaceae bacterium]